MAIDIVFSGPAQLDIDFATAPNLEVDELPEHRLGQHVGFDDSNQTAGYVITRQADGTFAMGEAGGVLTGISVGTSPPDSPYDGQMFIDTNQSVPYFYESTRGHWLGPIEHVVVTWPGTSPTNHYGDIGGVTADSSSGEGLRLFHNYVIVGYTEQADTNPGQAGSVISVKRDNVEVLEIGINNGSVGDHTESETTDVDFAADGVLACRLEDLSTATAQDIILDLWLRKKKS